LEERFLVRLDASQNGSRQRAGVLAQHDPHGAGAHIVGAVAIVPSPDDEVAVLELADTAVVAEDASQRERGQEVLWVDSVEGRQQKKPVDIVVGHLWTERDVPSLGSRDSDDLRHFRFSAWADQGWAVPL